MIVNYLGGLGFTFTDDKVAEVSLKGHSFCFHHNLLFNFVCSTIVVEVLVFQVDQIFRAVLLQV